jgi:hypothetical protein
MASEGLKSWVSTNDKNIDFLFVTSSKPALGPPRLLPTSYRAAVSAGMKLLCYFNQTISI